MTERMENIIVRPCIPAGLFGATAVGNRSRCTEDNEIAIGPWNFYADGTVAGPNVPRQRAPEIFRHLAEDGKNYIAIICEMSQTSVSQFWVVMKDGYVVSVHMSEEDARRKSIACIGSVVFGPPPP